MKNNSFSLWINAPKYWKLVSFSDFGKIQVGQFDFYLIPFRKLFNDEGPILGAESESVTRVSRPKCRSRLPHTTKPVTTAHQHRRQRDHDQETESQQQRVGHPWQADPGTSGKTESQQQRVSHPCKPEGTHGKTESQQQTVPQETPKQP